jgi:hypothetical protein
MLSHLACFVREKENGHAHSLGLFVIFSRSDVPSCFLIWHVFEVKGKIGVIIHWVFF